MARGLQALIVAIGLSERLSGMRRRPCLQELQRSAQHDIAHPAAVFRSRSVLTRVLRQVFLAYQKRIRAEKVTEDGVGGGLTSCGSCGRSTW